MFSHRVFRRVLLLPCLLVLTQGCSPSKKEISREKEVSDEAISLVGGSSLNCGLNAVATTGLIFGVEKEKIKKCLSALDSSRNTLKPTSLKEISDVLNSMGLSSVGYKNVTISELQDFLKNGSLVIAHLNIGHDGHLFVVKAGKDSSGKVTDDLEYYDFPYKAQITSKMLSAKIGKTFSGFCVVIQSPGSGMEMVPKLPRLVESPEPPAIREQKALPREESSLVCEKNVKIDLSKSSLGKLSRTVILTNRSPDPINIEKSKGSCSCYRGHVGPGLIAPNASAAFEFNFDPSKVSSEGLDIVILYKQRNAEKILSIPVSVVASAEASFKVITPIIYFVPGKKVDREIIIIDANDGGIGKDFTVSSKLVGGAFNSNVIRNHIVIKGKNFNILRFPVVLDASNEVKFGGDIETPSIAFKYNNEPVNIVLRRVNFF